MAGDLRRLRGDRDKKSVPHCIVHACMNGLFFLTTGLHRSFRSYITFTALLHHFYNTFTSFLQLIRHFHPLCHLYITPFLNVLKTGFPAAPATPHGHAINSFPFTVFGWEECRKQDLPRLSCVNFRAMHLRAYSCMP